MYLNKYNAVKCISQAYSTIKKKYYKTVKNMQGVIFRENLRKVDELFSLFFCENLMETKESLFGYFSSKTQTRLDVFTIFRENAQQQR